MRMKKIVTCEQKHEFWKEQELTVYEQPGEMQVVSIYPQVTYQTIDGFGGAFTEASAHTYGMQRCQKERNDRGIFW